MPSTLNPQGLHSTGTALIHRQAMGEIDDLILCTVNDQHRRGDFRYLVNAARQKWEGEKRTPLVTLTEVLPNKLISTTAGHHRAVPGFITRSDAQVQVINSY